MQITENEKTTYLFCAQLNHTKTKPLTIIEWNIIVKNLSENNLEPIFLLDCTPTELQKLLVDATNSQQIKIMKKVEERQKLGFGILELEQLLNSGFNVLFRKNFPKRLKKLKLNHRPPFFYYMGDISILSEYRALSVVGARDASENELNEVNLISKEAANKGILIISGGARGIDTNAVTSALNNGGKALIFPSEGLTIWAKKKEIRKHIENGKLLILSVQPINANFSGSYAMQRNKFIHSTGDITLIASSKISGSKKSGTWEGALENIKEKWSPLFVIGDSEGVKKLLEMKVSKNFTSLDEIFKSNNVQIEENLTKHFIELLNKATILGLSKTEIDNAFQKSREKVFDFIIKEESSEMEYTNLDLIETSKNERDDEINFTNSISGLNKSKRPRKKSWDQINIFDLDSLNEDSY